MHEKNGAPYSGNRSDGEHFCIAATVVSDQVSLSMKKLCLDLGTDKIAFRGSVIKMVKRVIAIFCSADMPR